MGDFSDDYGGYDILGLYEQREDDRRAQRAKLLTPHRTWVGLTYSEWSDLYEAHHDKYNLPVQGSPDGMDYERAIEAKLREKNFQHKEKNT